MFSAYPLFLSMMLLGILLTLSASSWFMAWIGLELNLLGFLPVLLNSRNIISYEMIPKYFLLSSVSSLCLLALTLPLWEFGKIPPINLIPLALGLKLGCAPFHSWFISFVSNMIPHQAWMLMTLQKLPPLFLLTLHSAPFSLFIFIVLSLFVGSLGGLQSSSLMKMMAYSSLSHVGWILSSILWMNQFWLIYFITYSLMTYPLLLFLEKTQFYSLSSIPNLPLSGMFLFSLALLSLGGLPPLLGFFPKFFILENMIHQHLLLLPFILIFSSILSLFFYLRMMYSVSLIYSIQSPKSFPFFPYQFYLLLSIAFPLLLPLL